MQDWEQAAPIPTGGSHFTGILPGESGKTPGSQKVMEGFLLSDAYISQAAHRPSLTALQVIASDAGTLLGYLGADFDLRRLPVSQRCTRNQANGGRSRATRPYVAPCFSRPEPRVRWTGI